MPLSTVHSTVSSYSKFPLMFAAVTLLADVMVRNRACRAKGPTRGLLPASSSYKQLITSLRSPPPRILAPPAWLRTFTSMHAQHRIATPYVATVLNRSSNSVALQIQYFEEVCGVRVPACARSAGWKVACVPLDSHE